MSLLHSERTQGFAADPDSYWKGEVFAYVGSIQNLKDLKDQNLKDPQKGVSLGYVGRIKT